jgi:hypothetical protein
VRVDDTEFARLDGDTGERDRLCRFHRHRDLAREFRKMERKERAAQTPIAREDRCLTGLETAMST